MKVVKMGCDTSETEMENEKVKENYRNFQEGPLMDRVYNTYLLMHTNQTVEFVQKKNLCQGEIIRELIRKQQGSISCVSSAKVPRMECHGSCGNDQCCVALRSKRRKFVFQCEDGSSFTEELERHVECGCAKCL